MVTKMTDEIVVTILAVQSYNKFAYYDHLQRLDYGREWKTKDYGYPWKKTEEYYKSLTLPEGLNHSRACFEAVMNYPIYGDIKNAERSEYGNYEFRY